MTTKMMIWRRVFLIGVLPGEPILRLMTVPYARGAPAGAASRAGLARQRRFLRPPAFCLLDAEVPSPSTSRSISWRRVQAYAAAAGTQVNGIAQSTSQLQRLAFSVTWTP